MHKPVGEGWTAERVELLKALHASGELSAAQIAVQLGGGLTRNAVISKVDRLNLQPNDRSRDPSRPKAERKPRSRPNEVGRRSAPLSRRLQCRALSVVTFHARSQVNGER
ncbi:MAG: GcrA family cell cycle regulator [Parvibaculaceae bacterium]